MGAPSPASAVKSEGSVRALPPENATDVLRRVRMFFHLHSGQVFDLVKTTSAEWTDDKAPRLSASLAFYTALSLAPLTVVVLAAAALVFGRPAADSQLISWVRSLAGREGAAVVQALLGRAHRSAGILATALGLITLFFGATSAVVDLKDSLNTVWHVPEGNAEPVLRSIVTYLRTRLVSFLFVLGAGFLLFLSLVMNALVAAAGAWMPGRLPLPEPALEAFDFVFSFLLITMLFGCIFRFVPDISIKASDVAIGAAVTSLLFSLGKLLIGIYLGRGAVGSAYGAAGSFVVLLFWLYYSSLVFFWGAEFTKVYTRTMGSRLTERLRPDAPAGGSSIIAGPPHGAEKELVWHRR